MGDGGRSLALRGAAPQHVVVQTDRPAPLTLATMGRVATDASDTWTFREWAARLATKAEPRDYRGQLKALYDGILRRWRYVQEPDEWVFNSPEALIRFALGVKYNDPNADPLKVDLEELPANEKGFGDCDDVSMLVAAGARALNMKPYWRVARGSDGAHVSVIVRTPTGELVSVDPVGHPKHPFGWALQTDDVRVFDLNGAPMRGAGAFSGVEKAMTPPTFYVDPMGRRPTKKARRTHWAATHAGDDRGPRALAIPRRLHRMMLRGVMVDGCPAYDDNGNGYTYDANRDLWVDDRLMKTRLGNIDEAFGGIGRRSRRRARRRARRPGRQARRSRRRSRRQKRRATIRRTVQRVAKPLRKAQAMISKSKLVQGAAGAVLSAYGIPPQLTRGVLQASGEIFEQGGLPAVIRLLKKDPKAAARLVARAAKMGARQSVKGGLAARFLSGVDEPGTSYMMEQGGRRFFTQPICALAGVDGLYELGALEVADTPTPGMWYRIKRGDNLLKVAERAWDDRGTRLMHSKWINNVAANQYAHAPTTTAFDKKQYGPSRISFSRRYAADPEAAIRGESGNAYALIFIPEMEGDEPPEDLPDVPDTVEPPEVEPPEVEPPVVPDTPELPPEDVVEPPDVPDTTPPDEDDVAPPVTPTDPDAEAKAACEAAGNFWNDIRRECEQVPTGPGDCPPGTVWDAEEQDCFIQDTPPPLDPVVPQVTPPQVTPPQVVPPVTPPTPPVLPPMTPPSATPTSPSGISPLAIAAILVGMELLG